MHEIIAGHFGDSIEIELTSTMVEKSTIDASQKVRAFLKDALIIDYSEIEKGQKVYKEGIILSDQGLVQKKVNFFRPNAKPNQPGDPRFWIYNLGKYATAGDKIHLVTFKNQLVVIPQGVNGIEELLERYFGDNQHQKENSDELHYYISSGLKNLIGKELITDDYVAIFELVKNSFDAYATKVDIHFNQLKTDSAHIIIEDNGKGMNFDDLLNKWFAVGRSAKKEGIEDKDYRTQLGLRKHFAGAKGVGRFSCDRLGGYLTLITLKDEENSSVEILKTDWNKFEENSEIRFEDIPVEHSIGHEDQLKYQHGTKLIIDKLNSSWGTKQILELRKQLEKLINPASDNTKQPFEINVYAPDFLEHDKNQDDYYEKINGPIRNLAIKNLEIKTTKIQLAINEEGTEINTILKDRDNTIYDLTEENVDFKLLANIKIEVLYLNQSAKNTFSRSMGFPLYKYGHVFVYKNGFRITPYGNYEEDSFGVDIRRAQKDRNRFSTRTITGRIDIEGDNIEFKESTSRDGGLIKNEHFNQLKSVYHLLLLRLEKYVVDVIKWGTNLDFEDLLKGENKDEVLKLIEELTQAKNIISLHYNSDIVDILSAKQEKSVGKLLKNLQSLAEKTGDPQILDDVILAQQQLGELKRLKEEAEEMALEQGIKNEEAREYIEFLNDQLKYFESSNRTLSEDAKGLVHSIKDSSKRITANIEILVRLIKSHQITPNKILEKLGTIKRFSDKTFKISKLITKADFKNQKDKRTVELAQYVEEYIHLYSDIYEASDLKFNVVRKNNKPLLRKISTLDLSVVFDNLISNSEKANASNIDILISVEEKKMEVIFSDDGHGLSDEMLTNPEQIFELGITNTDGSGIGLNIVRKVLKEMNAQINFIGNNVKLRGASFKLIFN